VDAFAHGTRAIQRTSTGDRTRDRDRTETRCDRAGDGALPRSHHDRDRTDEPGRDALAGWNVDPDEATSNVLVLLHLVPRVHRTCPRARRVRALVDRCLLLAGRDARSSSTHSDPSRWIGLVCAVFAA
jgi:hypothetical protein